MKSLPLLLIAVAMLAGCSTPPRQAKDASYLTKHVTTSLPVAVTYENLRQGFRYCDFANIGTLNCRPPEKNGQIFCDVYTGHTAGEAKTLMGTIQLSPESKGTRAVLRIQTRVAKNEDILTAWEILMSGKAREACP
ncbi:MAG: hypothetical protein GXX82_01885 [Syntrophorhabdus sp.]|nr:hypothetical protein [Syntrophorhabdus sp.]